MLMNGPNESESDPDFDGEDIERLRKEREEELCDTFRMFDFDKSGFISAKEERSSSSQEIRLKLTQNKRAVLKTNKFSIILGFSTSSPLYSLASYYQRYRMHNLNKNLNFLYL